MCKYRKVLKIKKSSNNMNIKSCFIGLVILLIQLNKTRIEFEETKLLGWSTFLFLNDSVHHHLLNQISFRKDKARWKSINRYKTPKINTMILVLLLVLCGDVELNPGPGTSTKVIGINPQPSTSTGIYASNGMNRDERYLRPTFQYIGDDSFSSVGSTRDNVDDVTYDSSFGGINVLNRQVCKSDNELTNSHVKCKNCQRSFSTRGIKFHVKGCLDKKRNVRTNLNNSILNKPVEEIDILVNCSNKKIDKTNYTCSFCGKHFKKHGLAIHMSKAHPNVRKDKNITSVKGMENQSDQNVTIQNKVVNTEESDVLTRNNDVRGLSGNSNNDGEQCTYCGKSVKNLQIHISRTHASVHRDKIVSKYTESLQEKESEKASEKSKALSFQMLLSEWEESFNQLTDLDDVAELNNKMEEFTLFLASAVNHLPGPKHPAMKYYNLRKNSIGLSNGKSYKKSSNPMRSSKREACKRQEKYLYEKAQFLFYNQRRKACRMIMGSGNVSCKISSDDLYKEFYNRFEKLNPSIRDKYENKCSNTEENGVEEILVTPEEMMTAMKSIAIDTSPGIDKVLMRVVKCQKMSVILAKMCTIMLLKGWVPECFKLARTVLIYKGGDVKDAKNWRPISICSVLRRCIERVLDKRLRQHVRFNPNQRGFTRTPGTKINVEIINSILTKAKVKKDDVTLVFLDINKAYDCVGHEHLIKTLDTFKIPRKLMLLIKNLQIENKTIIEASGTKTKQIHFKRGLLQGAPLSPTLYNLSTDFILNELSDKDVQLSYGYELAPDLDKLTVLGFADDLVIIGKDKINAATLTLMATNLLNSIGLELNPKKCQCIIIEKGQIRKDTIFLNGDMPVESILEDETIKYLGVNFSQGIVLNQENIIKNFKAQLDKLTSTTLLVSSQKFSIINQCIWPTLIYPFQNAPLHKLPAIFLTDLDKLVKSSVKEILNLPTDTPDFMLYSPKKYKGLGLIKAQWEAYIQQLNSIQILRKVKNAYIMNEDKFKRIETVCLKKLELEDIVNGNSFNTQQIRNHLREREFEFWKGLKQKGKGVELFTEYTPGNKGIMDKVGFSESEWKDCIKMFANVVPVRVLHGRSQGNNRCRHACGEIETLAHVLGFCPFGELLRNTRHHTIRSIIASSFKQCQNRWEVYEEVHCLSTDSGTRRVDILLIDRELNKALILDPTVRWEVSLNQPKEVNEEKRRIYESTFSYFKEHYKVSRIEVIGLFIGSRGTLSKFFVDFWNQHNLDRSVLKIIIRETLKGSILILRNHLYNVS